MKIKKLVSVILALIMISAAFTAAPLSAHAEDEPSDNNAVITITNNLNDETTVINCKVGDVITVCTVLDTSAIDDGAIASVQGTQEYSPNILKLQEELEEGEAENEYCFANNNKVFPVIGSKVVASVNETDGMVYFAGSTPKPPFYFTGDDNQLIVVGYKVTAAGNASVNTTVITLAKSDKSLTKLVDRSVLQDGYSFTFSSTDEHVTEHVEAVDPTKDTNGNIEYWKCKYCGKCFSDENAENEISLASTVIHHPYVVGQTLSLKDNIGVNFYLHIPDNFTENLPDDQISAAFSWGEGNHRITSDCTLNDPDNQLLNRTSKYGADFKATCMVAASRMIDTISMSFKCGEEEILTYNYRIVDYTENAAAAYNNDVELKDLLCYMLEYGGSVQKYNGYKADTDSASSYISNVYKNGEWESHKAAAPESIENDPTTLLKNDQDFIDALGIQFAGANLATTSQTEIRLSFSVINEELFSATTVSVKGKNIAFTDYNTGGIVYKRIIIDKISAKNTFDPITVTFKNGDSTLTRVYSAVNYYNNIMTYQGANTKSKEATKAMYLYSMSASARLKQSAQ